MSPIITLLTDFGTRDGYVGIMQGVMAGICPTVRIIDLSHTVPPHDIAAAQFILMNAFPHFPAGSIHVVVVDPGVGTERRGLAVEVGGSYLVGPDNGVFSGVLQSAEVTRAVELTNPDYWRTLQPSNTFHGRDIFAPAAAHLANGVPLTELGRPLSPDDLMRLPISAPTVVEGGIQGTVQYVDHFGNVITNIPGDWVQGKDWSALTQDQEIAAATTYGEVPLNSLVALIGSHGWVELAVTGSSAWERLRLHVGAPVWVRLTP